MFNNSDLTVMFENCSNRWLVIRDVVWTFEFWNLICQYVVNLSISTLILKYLKFELSFFWCITNSYVEIIKIIFLVAGSVVLARAGCDVRRCDLQKCDILHKELTTCAGAVMDNYGIFFFFYRNLISKIY